MRRASGTLAPAMAEVAAAHPASFRSCIVTHLTVSMAVAKQMPCAPGMMAVFHADRLAARIDERPAGISRVQRRVGLAALVDRVAGRGLRAAGCGRGRSPLPPSRCAGSRMDFRSRSRAGRRRAPRATSRARQATGPLAPMRTTAMSVSGSSPSRSPSRLKPSANVARMLPRRARRGCW